MAGSVNIYGKLHNASIGEYVVDTSEIIDEEINKTLEEINKALEETLNEHTLLLDQQKEQIEKALELVPTAVTNTQFSNLQEKEHDKLYLVFMQDGSLSKIYVGSTLIAKKGEKGFNGFPYNFPIVF